MIQFRYHYDDNGFSKKLFFLQYQFDIVTASPRLLRRYHHDIYLKKYLIDTVSNLNIIMMTMIFEKKIKFFNNINLVSSLQRRCQSYHCQNSVYFSNSVLELLYKIGN